MNILINYRHFPVAIGRYIHWAFERLGYNVISCGEYSSGKIPWGDQFDFPEWKMPPDVILPAVSSFPIQEALKMVRAKGYDPDMVVQAGDVSFLEGKADIPNMIIATDPHAVDYTPRLVHADYFLCMQNCYISKYGGGTWFPYGFDEDIHKRRAKIRIYNDVVFCGLQYDHRVDLLKEIERRGWYVGNAFGKIYDQYVEHYSTGRIAFNWSSKDDLPARFFEGMALSNMMVTNKVPDLELFPDIKEGRDYVGYSTKEEAIEKIEYYLNNPELGMEIAHEGWRAVRPHTYTNHLYAALKSNNITA